MDTAKAITDLLREAAEAHHEAHAATDGEDPEWPLWYAEYLADTLPALLEAKLTRSDIVYLLVLLDRKQALEAPGANWPRYYAAELLARYRPVDLAGD